MITNILVKSYVENIEFLGWLLLPRGWLKLPQSGFTDFYVSNSCFYDFKLITDQKDTYLLKNNLGILVV